MARTAWRQYLQTGVGFALAYSLWALLPLVVVGAIAIVGALSAQPTGLTLGGWLALLMATISTYVVAMPLAATMLWLTEPWRPYYLGYLVAGVLCAMSVYGTVDVALLLVWDTATHVLLARSHMTRAQYVASIPFTVLVCGLAGGMAGTVYWFKEQSGRRLTRP